MIVAWQTKDNMETYLQYGFESGKYAQTLSGFSRNCKKKKKKQIKKQKKKQIKNKIPKKKKKKKMIFWQTGTILFHCLL